MGNANKKAQFTPSEPPPPVPASSGPHLTSTNIAVPDAHTGGKNSFSQLCSHCQRL